MLFRRLFTIPLMLCASCASTNAQNATTEATKSPATQPTSKRVSWFDPEKHMRVSEVKPGMKGYGLSVFMGSKIERFEVEVVSILHNFNPGTDVILINCSGRGLEHTGSVGGMSGSPIYLTDEAGKTRLVGAFAYGWSFMKDPLAGVQPIEYMMELRDLPAIPAGAVAMSTRGTTALPAVATAKASWSMKSLIPLFASGKDPWESIGATADLSNSESQISNPKSATASDLAPLATPMLVAGMPPDVMDKLRPALARRGIRLLQSGGASSATTQPTEDPTIEPGSCLVAPMLTGDMEMSAVGTCTEVIGDRVFGFGHPFNNEGAISLPFGSGTINGILAQLTSSEKMGAFSRVRGTLTVDQNVGVAGNLGPAPSMIPIEFSIKYADGSFQRDYKFHAVRHPTFTPMATLSALSAVMTGSRLLPEQHTLRYSIDIEFAGNTPQVNRRVHLENVASATDAERTGAAQVMLAQVQGAIGAAGGNPFQVINVEKISGSVVVEPRAREAQILAVNVPKLKYHAGETVQIFVTQRPFRGAETVQPVTLELPHNLPAGDYQIAVSDSERYLSDEVQQQPSRFSAESADEVFAVVREATSVRRDALYIRLNRQATGLAIGRTALPHLPASRRQVMLASGRSNTQPLTDSTVKTIPCNYIPNGSADFIITIIDASKPESQQKGKPMPPTIPKVKAEEPAPKPATPKAEMPEG